MSEPRRTVIAGVPKAGKTSMAMRLFEDQQEAAYAAGRGLVVFHTDETVHLGWSESSAAVALWFDEPGPWIVEGVAAPRALRKWLAAHPGGKPCDVVIWLSEPYLGLTPGQATMGKGCATVFAEIESELRSRGVEIRRRA